jgi:hypothetical protein
MVNHKNNIPVATMSFPAFQNNAFSLLPSFFLSSGSPATSSQQNWRRRNPPPMASNPTHSSATSRRSSRTALCCRRLPVMQLDGDRQRTRRTQGRTTLHSVSHVRTLWISTERERVALPNVAAFSVMLFAIYSRCLHGLRPTITPPRALAL